MINFWIFIFSKSKNIFAPQAHLRSERKKPMAGFHGEQVWDDGRIIGVLVCYKTKKCNPLRFFSKSHHAWEWRWLRFCTRGYRAFWVLMGQWCCYILWQRFFGGSCYRSTSPWLARSIQSLPAVPPMPCRARLVLVFDNYALQILRRVCDSIFIDRFVYFVIKFSNHGNPTFFGKYYICCFYQ